MKNDILGKAGSMTKYEIRRNASEVLRKICKSLVMCGGGRLKGLESSVVRLWYAFIEGMLVLATDLAGKEKETYKDEGFYEKLEELKDLGEETDLDGLESVCAVFDDNSQDGKVAVSTPLRHSKSVVTPKPKVPVVSSAEGSPFVAMLKRKSHGQVKPTSKTAEASNGRGNHVLLIRTEP